MVTDHILERTLVFGRLAPNDFSKDHLLPYKYLLVVSLCLTIFDEAVRAAAIIDSIGRAPLGISTDDHRLVVFYSDTTVLD